MQSSPKNSSRAPIYHLVLVLLCLLGSLWGSGQTNTWDGSTADANWNTAANWSLDLVPTSAHDVVIPNGSTAELASVTVNTAAVCNTFTINGGTEFNTVTISGSNSLTVTGAVTIGGGAGSGDNKIIAVGAGTLTCGSVSIATTGNNNADSEITLSTGIVTVSGNITMNGTPSRNAIGFTNSGTVNCGGTISGGALRASTGTVNYNAAGNQTVGGYAYNNLTISGSGTKTLGANTTVGAALVVNAGTTLALSTFTLGSPNSTTLFCGATTASTISGSGAFTLGGNVTITNAGTGSNGALISCPVALGATRIFDVANDGTSAVDLTLSGIVSGGGFGITKNSSGTLLLSASNTYTGLTTVNAGTLRYDVANALSSGGVTVDGSSTFDIATFNDAVGTVTLIDGTISGTTGVLTGTSYAVRNGNISAILAGAVALTKTTSGTVTMSGTNTYTGVTTINAGVLSVATIGNGGAAGNLGQASNANGNIVLGGGTLQYTGATATTNRGFTLTTATTSNIDVTTNTLTMSGASATTTGALTKIGAGTLVFSGAKSYTGLTTVTAGTLRYDVANALSSGGVTVDGGSTFDVATFNDAVGTVTLIDGTISGSTGVLTGTSYDVRNGSISAILAGAVALTKTTAGTVTMSGTNTYTGGTTLNAGTLNINNTSALGASGTFTIAGGSIDNTSGADITTNDYSLSLNADFTYIGSVLRNLNLGAGAVTMSASRQITVSAGTLTIGGVINNNAQNITKAGAGTLSFGSQAVTLNDVSINAGTLVSTSNTLGIAGNFVNSGTFTNNSGTVNFNGAGAQNIAAATFNNLTASNSGTKTATGNLVVNGTLTIGSGIILDMTSAFTLTGTLGTVTSSGTIRTSVPTATTATPIATGKTWTGIVEYAATAGLQTVVNGTYTDLTLSNSSGTNTAGGTLTVNGLLTTTALGTLDMVTNTIAGASLTTSGTGTINTQNTSSTPFPIGRTWSGTIGYNATTGTQTVVEATYTNLTLANNALKNAGGDMTVNGVLNIGANQGDDRGHLEMTIAYGAYALAKYTDSSAYSLASPTALPTAFPALKDNTSIYNNLNSYILTLGSSATVTGTGDVTGKVRRTTFVNNTTYAFGNTNTQFRFDNTSGGTLPTQLTVVCTRGANRGNHPDKTNTVKRIYQVLRTGGTAPTRMTIRLAYDDATSELNGNTESNLILWDHHIPYGGITPHEHGKTNQSTTSNWVELTSHGILYLAAESDVNFTKYWMISNKVSTDTSWLGAVPGGSWTTASNWSTGIVPTFSTKVVIPNADSTANDPTLSGSDSVGTIHIKPGGILNGSAGTLVLSGGPAINGGAGTWLNEGTFNAGTSTVVFRNADATIAGTTTFNNMTIQSGKATIQQDADVSIGGTLTNNDSLDAATFVNTVRYTGASQTVSAPNGFTAGYSNLVLGGTGTAVTPATLTVKGNYTANQAVDYTTNSTTLVMNGTLAQSIAGTDNTVIPTLTINNSTGVNLARNVTVGSSLTLTSGILGIGANTLTLNGTFSRTSGTLSSNGTTSNLTIGGSGTIGNLFFDQTTPGTTNRLNTFTMNRSGETVSLGNSLEVGTSLTLTNGKFGINGQTLTLNSSNITSDGTNSLVGSATSNLTISGTGSINNLFFDQSTPGTTNTIATLTMNRSGQTVSLGNSLEVGTSLTLTNGKFGVNGQTLTLNSGNITSDGTNSLVGSASSNLTVSGTGSINNLFFDQTTPGTTNMIGTLTMNRTSETVSLGNNVEVGTSLTLSNGKFGINGQTLTLNSGNITSDETNSLVGSATSNLTISGTGSINNLFFDQTTPGTTNMIGTLTMNRTSETVSLGNNVEVGTSLTLTNGKFGVNGQTLTLNSGNITSDGTNSLVGSATSNLTISGTGSINNLFFDQSTPGTTNTIATLTMNRSGETVSLGNSLEVGTSLTLTNGKFGVNGQTLTLNSGNITSDGTNSLVGSATSNLTISGTGSINNLFFDQTTPGTTNMIGTLTMNRTSETVSLGNNVEVGTSLTLTNGKFGINGQTLTLNSGNITSDGTNSLVGSATSNLTISGTGSINNLFLDQTTPGTTNMIGTLTMNRTSEIVSLGNNVEVVTSLTLTNGKFGINGQTLTLNSGNITSDGTNSLVGSATSNLTISGTGSINNLFFDQSTPGTTNTIATLTVNRSGQTVSLGTNAEVSTSLTLTSGNLGLNGQTLTLSGNITCDATNALVGSASGSHLSIAGSGALNDLFFDQSTPGTTNRLQNITYNRTTGGTMGLGDSLQITGTLTPTAGTLASNGFLTLISNALGTARIADGGCTTCSYLTGNVKVQRYVPAVARRWRFLGSTVQNATLADWKNETYVTGTGGAANGFDATGSNAASVFSYNETLPGDVNAGWTAATNITNNIEVGKGYRVFIRGDRSDAGRLNGTVTNQNEVTLDLVGEPYQGNITLPVSYTSLSVDSNDGWNLVSNPYASPYDCKAFYTADSNTASCFKIEPTIWVLNAQNGGYYSYNAKSDAGNLEGGMIPAGASFWVKAYAATPALIFQEQYKGVVDTIKLFKTNENEGFNIQLYYDSITWDDVSIKYLTGSTPNFDRYDIRKLTGTVTISTYGSDNAQLSFSCRPVSNTVDTIKLNVSGVAGAYKLNFSNNNMIAVADNVWLFDTYTSTVTDLTIASTYNFNIVSGMAASQGKNRFYIVVGNSAALPVKLLHFTAQKTANKQVALHWATAQELNSKHFEVERSADGKEFKTIATIAAQGNTNKLVNYETIDELPMQENYYRLKQVDVDGAIFYSTIQYVLMDELNASASVKMYPIPATDVLTIEHTQPIKQLNVYDVTGKMVQSQIGSSSIETIHVNNFQTGVYIVEILNNEGQSIKQKFTKE